MPVSATCASTSFADCAADTVTGAATRASHNAWRVVPGGRPGYSPAALAANDDPAIPIRGRLIFNTDQSRPPMLQIVVAWALAAVTTSSLLTAIWLLASN